MFLVLPRRKKDELSFSHCWEVQKAEGLEKGGKTHSGVLCRCLAHASLMLREHTKEECLSSSGTWTLSGTTRLSHAVHSMFFFSSDPLVRADLTVEMSAGVTARAVSSEWCCDAGSSSNRRFERTRSCDGQLVILLPLIVEMSELESAACLCGME